MLQNPDPDDWLMWRRTLDSWGYSPLNQVDRGNISELREVWSQALVQEGSQQGTPIVYNGIMDYNDQNLSVRWDLATMISDDAGSTWKNSRLLEFSDPHVRQERRQLLYCYPSLLWNDGVLHVTYFGVVDGQILNMLYQRLESDWFTKNGVEKN